MTTYSINLTDSDSTPAWMALCTAATPGAQNSGRVRYTVTTEQPDALEAALDADESVVEYEAQAPSVHVAISAGSESDVSEADGAMDYGVTLTIDDREIDGQITLWPDAQRGGSMGTCGSPLEVWCSSSLIDAIRTLPGGRGDRWAGLAAATIAALAGLDDGDVR